MAECAGTERYSQRTLGLSGMGVGLTTDLLLLMSSMEGSPAAIRTSYEFVLSQARKAALLLLPDANVANSCLQLWEY